MEEVARNWSYGPSRAAVWVLGIKLKSSVGVSAHHSWLSLLVPLSLSELFLCSRALPAPRAHALWLGWQPVELIFLRELDEVGLECAERPWTGQSWQEKLKEKCLLLPAIMLPSLSLHTLPKREWA